MTGDTDPRLVRRLRRLAEPARFAADGRRIISKPGVDPLAAMVAEIDETILPRRLEFRAGGATLACIARSGRLLELVALPAAAAAAGPVSLDGLDKAGMATLRQSFAALAAAAGEVTVGSFPLDDGPAPGSYGTAATALAAAWGLDLDAAPAVRAPLDTLFGACGPVAAAWSRLSAGRIAAAGGPPEAQRQLAEVAADAPEAGRPVGESPRCLVLGGEDRSAALVIAEDGGERLLMLMQSRDLSRVAAAWRQAVG